MDYSERKALVKKYSRKRRPTALDRDIADHIFNKMPLGYHCLWIEIEDGKAYLKPEGGMLVWFGNKRITIIPKVKQ